MKRRLLILLGLSIISTSAFGVTTWAETESATEETATTDADESAEVSDETETAEEASDESEAADSEGEMPPVTGDEKISELIDLSGLAEEAGQPDIANMTLTQWNTYEFHKDYATIISDITSYDHDFEREFLDAHWSTYLMCTTPNAQVTDEQRAEALLNLHNMRVNAQPTSDVEANRIYLWPEGKVPTVTDYQENTDYQFADDPDFAPYMVESLVEEGTEVKGAVILASGGSRLFRSNVEEAYESALALNELGYQCFIVNYRLVPYEMEESSLDFARAVRYVRANAEKYGIDENKIACAGFSAGGSVITDTIDKFMGDANASELVADYEPDELDQVSADINAYLSIYANYDTESINLDTMPETFFVIGGEDGWESVSDCFDYVREAGIKSELHVFAGAPHGFGAGTHADGTVYENAAEWPKLADVFMQDVYAKAAAGENAAE